MTQNLNATTTPGAEVSAIRATFAAFTPENVKAFAHGQAGAGRLLGLRAEEAYGIAQLAYNLIDSGQLDDAQALAEGLVALVPEDPYFHALQASVYASQERYDEALVALDEALELRPDDLHSRVNRGELRLRQGDLEAALEDFQTAIEIDPEAKEPMTQRAQMLVAVAKALFDQVVAKHQASAVAAS